MNFRITGDEFNPDIISKELQIEPNECWKKGDKVKNRSVLRDFSCWNYKIKYEESLDVNNQLIPLIDKIKSNKNKLIEMKKHQNLDYKINIVIQIENNEKPAIYLNSESIEFANSINAEFDIDLYTYS
ncbi:MAG: DUF4279 domain-containing protein [Mobilitalea sp.]